MERTIEELKAKKRDDASKSEDEAIQELVKAKEKLEEILKQLREEEKKLLLVALEARFQQMLEMQLNVYQETLRLAKAKNPGSKERSISQKLAGDENEIKLDAQKALTLLKEEGSSVAFPQALEAILEDVDSIKFRLGRFQVGELTQTIERDVIEALEELIEALQDELEQMKEDKQKQQQGQPQNGRPKDQSLVQELADLKMLRSLQLRVNRRTKRIGQLIDGEQATDTDLIDQLEKLAGRQERIQRATFDLAIGKNKK